MASEYWSRVSELFDRLRNVPAEAREAWLEASGATGEMRRDLLALTETYDADPAFLEAPLGGEPVAAALRDGLAAAVERRRIGPYRCVREIGRGGMGVVYEAERDGGDFTQRVALKVLPFGWGTSSLAERFRLERRLLARLDHPGIARLIDGGATDDGTPYFVMELVDGVPIDVWCDRGELNLPGRIDLMLAVCDAVAYAHRNLVIHRDLKSANILVGADGRPKLLDFGIAKIVSEEVEDRVSQTRTGQQAFTPGFASPEQVRGEAVTTASDVYSLGVLLYRLFAGRPPYSVEGLSAFEAMRAVCETEPPRPSRVAAETARRTLEGDLDNIVLKALRKEAAGRYGSVEALADDLRAWRERRPVAATRATPWYRGRKLIARHRVKAAAAAALVLALALGGATTAWQAHVARLERDRADARFAQVRQFSRSILFELHEAISGLPGATGARQLLLDRAVQFLDGLAKDAGADQALRLELAEGYRKLGQVQGSGFSENVGDVTAATASFEKAVGLSEAVLRQDPRSLDASIVLAGALDDLSGARLQADDAVAATRAFDRHRGVVEAVMRDHPRDSRAVAVAATSYSNLAFFLGQRERWNDAQAYYTRAIALFDALPPEVKGQDNVMAQHAFALKRSGAILLSQGDLDGGERRYRAALAIDEQAIERRPGDARARFDMTFALTDLGLIAKRRGDLAAAERSYHRALDIRQEALDADPRDVRAMRGVASVHEYLAGISYDQRRLDEAIGHLERAVAMRDRLLAVSKGGSPAERIRRAQAQTHLARLFLDKAADERRGAGRDRLLREAAQLLEAAGPVARQAAAAEPSKHAELVTETAAQVSRLHRLGG